MSIIIKHLIYIRDELNELIMRCELRRIEIHHIPKFWMDVVRDSVNSNPEIHEEEKE